MSREVEHGLFAAVFLFWFLLSLGFILLSSGAGGGV